MILRIPELSFFHKSKEGVHHICCQLGAGNLLDNGHGLIEIHPLPIRTIGVHGIKGIRNRNDLCHAGNILSLETLGITLSIRTLMMVTGSNGQLRHDTDVLQHTEALKRMGFDDLELIIRQLTRLVQHLRRNGDLPDVMQKRDIVILLYRLLVVPQFLRQHGRVFRHTGGMTVGIFILHIDGLCEGFDHLANEDLVLCSLFLQFLYPALNIQDHDACQNRKSENDRQHPEPGFLIHRLGLDDGYGQLLISSAHGIGKLHNELILPTRQVGVVKGFQTRPVDGHTVMVKAFQVIGHLRIHQ